MNQRYEAARVPISQCDANVKFKCYCIKNKISDNEVPVNSEFVAINM